jgi:hypothetical protein
MRKLDRWFLFVSLLSLAFVSLGSVSQLMGYGRLDCPSELIKSRLPALLDAPFALFDDGIPGFKIADIFTALQAPSPVTVKIPLIRSGGTVHFQEVVLTRKSLRVAGFNAWVRPAVSPLSGPSGIPDSGMYEGIVKGATGPSLAVLYIPRKSSANEPEGFISGFLLSDAGWFFIEPVRSLLKLNHVKDIDLAACGFAPELRTHIVYQPKDTDFDIVLDPRCLPAPRLSLDACNSIVSTLDSGVAINVDLPSRMVPETLPVRARITNNRSEILVVDVALGIRRTDNTPIEIVLPLPQRMTFLPCQTMTFPSLIATPRVNFSLGDYIIEVRLVDPMNGNKTLDRQVKSIRVSRPDPRPGVPPIALEEILDRNNNNRLDDDELALARSDTEIPGTGGQRVSQQRRAEIESRYSPNSTVASNLLLRTPEGGYATSLTLTVVGDSAFNSINDEKQWYQRQEEVINLVDSLFSRQLPNFPQMNMRVQALEVWESGGPGSAFVTNPTAVAMLCDFVTPNNFPHTDARPDNNTVSMVHLMSGRNFAPMEKTDFGGNASGFGGGFGQKGIIGVAENIGGNGRSTQFQHPVCTNPSNPGVGMIFSLAAHHSVSQHVPWISPFAAPGDTRNYNALLSQRFLLFAHELGHNLNAPHTVLPPEDIMEDRACNSSNVCSPPGEGRTIMSPRISQDVIPSFFQPQLANIGTRADNNSRIRECAANVTCPAP